MFTVGYGCARLFLLEGSDFLEQIALRVGAFLYAFLHSRGSLQSTYESKRQILRLPLNLTPLL